MKAGLKQLHGFATDASAAEELANDPDQGVIDMLKALKKAR
ncbi:MAG: hypothetical protein ABJL55_08370 [Roseibium sp.]